MTSNESFSKVTISGSPSKVSFLVIYWLIQAGQHRNFSSILGVWSTPHTFVCSHAQSPSWQVELKHSDGETTELVDVFSPCKTDSSVYCYGKDNKYVHFFVLDSNNLIFKYHDTEKGQLCSFIWWSLIAFQ